MSRMKWHEIALAALLAVALSIAAYDNVRPCSAHDRAAAAVSPPPSDESHSKTSPTPLRLGDWTGSPGASFAVVTDCVRDRLHLISGDRGALYHSTSSGDGTTWTRPRELVRGDSQDVAVDKLGVVHLVYKSPERGGRVEYRTIADNQLSKPTDISASAGERPAKFYAPRIAVDGGNNVHILYWSACLEGEKRDGWRAAYVYKSGGNANFAPPELWRDRRQVGFSKYGDLFIDRDGNAHIFYVTVSDSSHGIERRVRHPSGAWGTHDRWDSRLMADWSMAAAVDRDGVVHVAAQRIVNKEARVIYQNNRADRNELANCFDAGVDLTETYTDLLVEDNGDAWLTTGHREGPGRPGASPLNVGKYYHYNAANGNWGQANPLSPDGSVNVTARQSGHPRLIRCRGETRLIYLQSEDGQSWSLWQRVLEKSVP